MAVAETPAGNFERRGAGRGHRKTFNAISRAVRERAPSERRASEADRRAGKNRRKLSDARSMRSPTLEIPARAFTREPIRSSLPPLPSLVGRVLPVGIKGDRPSSPSSPRSREFSSLIHGSVSARSPCLEKLRFAEQKLCTFAIKTHRVHFLPSFRKRDGS